MSRFYHQPGLDCPRYPPQMPISDPEDQAFAHACRFWRVVHEAGRAGGGGALASAEFKFRELLAWSNGLPARLRRDGGGRHAEVLLLWLHAAIVDIFRPFVGPQQPRRTLRTFSSRGSSLEAVYAASVGQLRRLALACRPQPACSILWQTAMTSVADCVLDGTPEESWSPYLALCVHGRERLGRAAEAITRTLLSLALRKSDDSGHAARRILRDLDGRGGGGRGGGGDVRAAFAADLSLADQGAVESLAARFDEKAMLKEYTHILDEDEDTCRDNQ